jgi:hypothetical protein
VSFSIELGSVYVAGQTTGDRHPLFRLNDGRLSHIHGEVRIVVAGEMLPALGYFGPDDVCLNTWCTELAAIRTVLSSSESAVHVFDEGEEGQPSFVFRRQGDHVLVSVLEGTGGGRADPSWSDVPIEFDRVIAEIDVFLGCVEVLVSEQAGAAGRRWIDRW